MVVPMPPMCRLNLYMLPSQCADPAAKAAPTRKDKGVRQAVRIYDGQLELSLEWRG